MEDRNTNKRPFAETDDESPLVAVDGELEGTVVNSGGLSPEGHKRICTSSDSVEYPLALEHDDVLMVLDPVGTLEMMQAKQLELDHLRQTIGEKSENSMRLPQQTAGDLHQLIAEKEEEIDNLLYCPDFLERSYFELTTARINNADKDYQTEPCNRDRLWKLLRSGIYDLTVVLQLTFIAPPVSSRFSWKLAFQITCCYDYIIAFVQRCRKLESYTIDGLSALKLRRFERFMRDCGRGLSYHPRARTSDVTHLLALPGAALRLPRGMIGRWRNPKVTVKRPASLYAIRNCFIHLPAKQRPQGPVTRRLELAKEVDCPIWPFPDCQLEWLARRFKMSGVDFQNKEEVEEYLQNIGIEYRFQCYSEKRPDGCHRLGDFMEVIKKDYEKAAVVYQHNCDTYSYAHSCFKLGNYKMIGRGLQSDGEGAFKDHVKACNKGYSVACYQAGLLKYSGSYGVQPDREQARELLEKGCLANDSESCYLLSTSYLGKGDRPASVVENTQPEDRQKAFEFTRRGCNLNHIYACANLHQLYKLGMGCEANEELATAAKRKAVALRDMYSRNSTGVVFGEG
ncbi:putative Cytochrome c oxidase assembly factor 7B [Hypsibius exemplaris]|uniref:Cytochrome c oxidase assembly factor 7B n=1 Tax=Hypsibius exemplaris TaxID=2072580 RepID=A0A1W0WGG2_HYPEX|nr:putative Cytochrome c oxidase assembly factor 7B [Hypsibius exemplaris]